MCNRTFEHGKVRAVDDKLTENPRFKAGTVSHKSYAFSEILVEYILLRMVSKLAQDICGEAAHMLGKLSSTDKIIHRYMNGFRELAYDFDGFVNDIASEYGLNFEGVDMAERRAIDIAETAVFKVKAEAERLLRISHRHSQPESGACRQ